MIQLSPQVHTVLQRLESAGFEAFLVGGFVRDAIRGVPLNTDWDITTSALPDQVKSIFSDHRLIETGLQHGTVTVLVDAFPLEITTYRIDESYSDHRRPDSVRFTRSLEEDLARRDFTMNALAYHPSTGIVDPFSGQRDLANRLIRCVGDPDRRFREDGLRILRALRFSATLELEIEAETAAAIHRNKELLHHIAPERVQTELTKLLCGPNAGSVLHEYRDVFSVIIPEFAPMFDFEQHNLHHDKDIWFHTVSVVSAINPTPVLRWSALLHDIGKPPCFSFDENGIGHFYGHAAQSTILADAILTRLRFDNAGRERIVRLVRYHDLPISADIKQIKRLLNKHGVDATRELIELHRADTLGLAPSYWHRTTIFSQAEAMIVDLLRQDACFSLRDLAIRGTDVLALGLTGKEVGTALELCLNAVIDEQVPNEVESLITFLRQSSCFSQKI